MTKETPVVRAHIDLTHIAMGQINQNMAQLETLGRITEEHHQDITRELDSLGEVIGNALHPEQDQKDGIYIKVLKKPSDIIEVHKTLENIFGE